MGSYLLGIQGQGDVIQIRILCNQEGDESIVFKQIPRNKGNFVLLWKITEENPFRTQDLDDMLFLDMYEFAGKIPVVMMDSPILYSFLIEIHLTQKPEPC